MRWIGWAKAAILAFLYPQSCVLCGRWTLFPDCRPLCRSCARSLPRQWLPTCRICGIPVPGELPGPGYPCSRCRSRPPAFDRSAAWGVYQGSLRTLIREYKFKGRQRLDAPLAELLAETFACEFAEEEIDWLLPVPIHAKRIRERGFDPVRRLACALSKRLEIPVTRPIRRIRHTAPQFGLDREARRKNLRDAFRLQREDWTPDHRILLIDDILTTGTTAEELSRVLKQSGCGWVGVLTVARVPFFSD